MNCLEIKGITKKKKVNIVKRISFFMLYLPNIFLSQISLYFLP